MNAERKGQEGEAENFFFELPPGVRLDKYLAEILTPRLSRSQLQKLIERGNVFIENTAVLKCGYVAKKSQTGYLVLPVGEPAELLPNYSLKLNIVFEDPYFLVVDKAAGMTVHPGSGTQNDTLVHALLAHFPHLPQGHGPDRPGLVHRLDRDTRGLLLVAKTSVAHRALSLLFARREIKKIYHALVWGNPPKQGRVEGFIRRHPHDRKKMQFIKDQAIRSRYASLEYEKVREGPLFSLIEVTLHTGRTHQIRATFSALGFPILGDPLYSDEVKLKRRFGIKEKKGSCGLSIPLCLQASRLVFEHPFTHEVMDFSLGLPQEWEAYLELKAAPKEVK
ncbi:MAG: RluA family pseudouridine synthase [Leptospiraceae bacterium]|nr:RluA family pseudouridine synthase [Leptospiraceae bacterium]MDW8306157.1 RluA family pseudouridine synthase [Leptospiraceae bacterium]